MNPSGYEAAVRKLEATLRRQEEAAASTRAQIEVFKDLVEKSRQASLELVRKSGK